MKKLILQSYDKSYLLTNLSFCLNFFKKNNIKYKFFIFPDKKKSISLLKSPHVYKKFKEHFIRKISKVAIETDHRNIQILISRLNLNKNLINIKFK